MPASRKKPQYPDNTQLIVQPTRVNKSAARRRIEGAISDLGGNQPARPLLPAGSVTPIY